MHFKDQLTKEVKYHAIITFCTGIVCLLLFLFHFGLYCRDDTPTDLQKLETAVTNEIRIAIPDQNMEHVEMKDLEKDAVQETDTKTQEEAPNTARNYQTDRPMIKEWIQIINSE